jgi:hypothetical protein
MAPAISHTFWACGTEINPAPSCPAAWAVANKTAWTKWRADNGLEQDRKLVEIVEEIRQPLQRALVRVRSMRSRREPHLRLVPSAAQAAAH